jgi:hypothetical protein
MKQGKSGIEIDEEYFHNWGAEAYIFILNAPVYSTTNLETGYMRFILPPNNVLKFIGVY